MSTTMIIRTVTEIDNRVLDDIEARSDRTFLKLPGFDEVINAPRLAADLDPASHKGGIVLLAESDAPIGYVFGRDLDDCLYVAQISVVPEAQGRGAGTALLDALDETARQRGQRGLTLITFRDVPWNAPYYEHRGFHVLGAEEMGPELAAEVRSDACHAGRYGERCAMGRFFAP